MNDFHIPPERRFIAPEFRVLAKKWKEETMFLSSITDIEANPSYQEIIKMGPVVVPLILRDLKEELNMWFGALTSITGENPILPEHVGNIEKMAEDWFAWDKQRNPKNWLHEENHRNN